MPYAVVVVLGVVVIGVAAVRITAGPGQRKLPEVIARRESQGDRGTGGSELMAGTTTKAGSNGRLITREDLQAAYSQVMGEGEATARAAAPRGLAVAGAIGILAPRRWPSWPAAGAGRAKSAVVEIRRL